MAYTLKKLIANAQNFGSTRSTSNIKYIVIHYTANDGDTDEANAKYFKNNVVKASAHYFVDSDSITQSVEDNRIAYGVGGSKYANCSTTGGGAYYGKCTNSNSLSIELCDDKKNGTIYPSAATIANAIDLTKKLMKKYNVPASRVIRHFDVNGKACPAYWCGSATKNAKWKSEFWNKLSTTTSSSSTTTTTTATTDWTKAQSKNSAYAKGKKYTTTTSLNLRVGAGTDQKILKTLAKGTTVMWYGYYTVRNSTTWLYVQVGNTTGFVSKKYLQ